MVRLFGKLEGDDPSRASMKEGSLLEPSRLRPFLASHLSRGSPVFLITRDYFGITREFPPGRFPLNVLWLTTVEHPNAVNPRDLHKIEFAVIRDTSIRRSKVVLDGFEYLMLENGLVPALRFVSKVRDIAVMNGTQFYVVLSDALTEREKTLLKRTMGVLV